MSIEMFQLFQTRFIVCLPVIRSFDNPVAWEIGLGVLVREVIKALDD
jgi:hypothetical protein